MPLLRARSTALARVDAKICPVELPGDTPVPAPSAPQPDISWAGATAIAFVILYSLTLAAGGGAVFYASIRPVSIPTGYFAPLIEFPWSAAALLLAAAWLVGPVALLITGLIHLLQKARRTWWSALAWVGALAAGTAIGYVITNEYGLLFTAYPKDLDGSPLGPSRWAPGTPYWQALMAAGGQLALGAIMIALITASTRRSTAAKSAARHIASAREARQRPADGSPGPAADR